MTAFTDILVSGAAQRGVVVASKKQLFQKLGEIAQALYGVSAELVVDGLTERERLGSTGFGGGIAIPHAKLEPLERLCAIVLVLDEPMSFEAIDTMPVDVVFALLSPVDSGADHLKTLARVSRFLRSEQNVARLRGAGSDDALFALLTGSEARDAA